jgi:hypothetical protein
MVTGAHAQQPMVVAPGAVLATAHFGTSGGVATVSGAMTMSLGQLSFWGFVTPGQTLFSNLILTPDMVGQTFIDTASSEPYYANFVSLLTDGVSERVGLAWDLFPGGGGGTRGGPEPTFFDTHPSDWNGVDLQGYPITGIGLTLNQLSMASPGSNPTGTGNWTDYSFDATISVYTVPEPGTLSLLMLSLPCAWWVRSRTRGD